MFLKCYFFNLFQDERFINALEDSETAGTSIKQIAHFGQNIKTQTFRRWDYGKRGNMEIYETETPPEYDLSEVTVNVTFYYSIGDNLVFEKDVLDMARDMENCAALSVPRSTFQHFDFIVNPDVKFLVTDHIVDNIKK